MILWGDFMYANTAYLNNQDIDVEDLSHELIVESCGNFRMTPGPKHATFRSMGRKDYQVIYIAAGVAHFYFNGKERILGAGNTILYRPYEMQNYVYYPEDKTEVYWVHFTGSGVERLLEFGNVKEGDNVFYTGTSPDYQWLFRRIIQELQQCEPHYEEIISLLLKDIFYLVLRNYEKELAPDNKIQKEVSTAAHYFNANYNKNISIDDYAASRYISPCWFIRNFKQYMGITPMQYIISIRISNAQSLLENTDYNIKEVAEIVGYDNPLYFSRIFTKQVGMSPKEYKKKVLATP